MPDFRVLELCTEAPGTFRCSNSDANASQLFAILMNLVRVEGEAHVADHLLR
jgi:hypothetical protein